MNWDEKYRIRNRIWGDGPSELAAIAVARLSERGLDPESASVVDLGCGYGRDAEYVRQALGCRVLGIDSSATAIEMARGSADDDGLSYACCDFSDVPEAGHDAVLASNLYHLLEAGERRRLGQAGHGLLKPGGTLFLNAVSERDPHHFGEGAKRGSGPGDVAAASEDELRDVFGLLEIVDLYEHEYIEPHAAGDDHHHISWILAAERPLG